MTDLAAPRPGEWQRLHPLSPLLRGGVVLIALLGYAASQLFDRVLGSVGLGEVVPGPGEVPFDDSEVADGPRSVILDQVTNGLAVRMAVLFLVNGGQGPSAVQAG